MKKIDNDGLLLCKLQADTFELSASYMDTSSEIFMRRFAHSDIAKLLDNEWILETNLMPRDILDRINEEYGESQYGSVKYTKDELHWIGYIYRYFAYTYGKSSRQVYKIVKPKELREVYLPYHTMDPAQAIDRILEAKGLAGDGYDEMQRQLEIMKRVRAESKKASRSKRK